MSQTYLRRNDLGYTYSCKYSTDWCVDRDSIGHFVLALATFVVGFLLALVGLFQTRWLIGSNHWVIQVIHLLLGLSAIGLAETISGRYRRMTAKKITA